MNSIAAVLSSPDKWTKHTNHRDIHGNHITNINYIDKAVRHCLYGAADIAFGIDWTENSSVREQASKALKQAVQEITKDDNLLVSTFNDDPNTTYEDVIKVARRADEIMQTMEN